MATEETRELDLEAVVAEVLSGRQSVEAARRRIAEHALAYGGSPDETGIIDRRMRLAQVISERLAGLADETSSGRLLDLARLYEAAAGLLAPGIERFVDLAAATRLLELGNHSFAHDLLENARANLDDADPEEELAIQCQWLRCLRLERENERLAREIPPVLELARALDDDRSLIVLLDLQARALAPRDPSAAIASVDEAIERRTNVDPERLPASFLPLPGETELWSARGEIARGAGRFEDALRSYEKARELAARAEMDRAAAYMLSEIGVTWQLAGEPARAAKVLRLAAAEVEKLGDRRAVLRWTYQLAEDLPEGELLASDILANALRLVQQPEPDPEAVLAVTRRAIAKAREERLPEVEILARNLLGCFYGHQKAFYRARMALEEALHLARKNGMRHHELIVLLNLGMILINLRDLRAAQDGLEQAVVLGERLRAEARSTEVRKTLNGRLVVVYELLMLLYLGWNYENDSSAQEVDPDRLLRLSQQAQAVNLAGWLALRTVSETLRDPEVREAARAFRETEARIERAAVGRAPIGLLLEERERRERRLEAALAAAGHPHGVDPDAAPVIGLSQLTAELPPRTLFVDLFAAEQHVYFIAVSGEGDPRCDGISWGQNERLEFLERWDAALTAVRRSLASDEDLRGWRLQADPLAVRSRPAEAAGDKDSLEGLLAELRRTFFQPLLDAVLGKEPPARIYLSPHRELYNLPFWALFDSLPETCFSILPSAGCLPLLAKRVREPGARRFKIGDVTRSLPFSELELDSLAGAEGLPARLDAILEHAPETGLLHFAGHGVFDGINPYDSGLIIESMLPPGIDSSLFGLDRHLGAAYRRLTVTGILSALELSRCSLVVLSACCTGLPQLHPASEFTSLPAAFLVAGARTVVASLWPTHDGATALLMQELYAHLGRQGDRMSPAAALHAARRRLARMTHPEVVERLGTDRFLPKAERPFASPVYTMPFQCYGLD